MPNQITCVYSQRLNGMRGLRIYVIMTSRSLICPQKSVGKKGLPISITIGAARSKVKRSVIESLHSPVRPKISRQVRELKLLK